jgi:CS domain
MSKPIDYSKFDQINENESDDEDHQQLAAAPTSKLTSSIQMPTASASVSMIKDPKTGRFSFQYNGNEVYQWEQTLDDVTIYITPPPHVSKGNQINVVIQPSHFKLGLVGGTNWFLDEPTFDKVDVSESTWSLEDGVITIYLIKAHRGMLWDAALKGNNTVALDPLAKEDVKKSLLLERFQEENPGFDFRDAQFNGGVPDARTFMGGVNYS